MRTLCSGRGLLSLDSINTGRRQEIRHMLSREINEQLTRVSAGTPMGDLMRRYWHPVAASRELEDSPFRTKEVDILGEKLVLFRDRGGKLGLIDRVCPHR